jgi:MHS family proline/betaine transporter-like MFS transporter
MKRDSSFHLISAALAGHILEFYDFTMFMVFAVQLGALFFPNDSVIAQTLSSLAVFAVGFLMRPIGGIFFGHIGDTHGRKKALIISVLGMAACTFCIALLPTYHSLGILAPILLVLLRLGQGFCVGGESAGAAVFLLEHLKKFKPGLIGGIVNAGLITGILLAMATGLFLNKTFVGSNDTWRYAFALGGVLGIVGLYIRLAVNETPVFEEMRKKRKTVSLPIKKVLFTNRRNVLLAIIYGGFFGVSGYLIVGFLNVFFQTIMSYNSTASLEFAATATVMMIFFLPFFGWVSDKIGYSRTLIACCIAVLLVSIPIFELLATGLRPSIYVGLISLSALSSAIHAPLYPFMIKIFTPEQRYSGIAFCLNLGIAIFGGTCSMISLWLIGFTGDTFAPAYYWSTLSALTLLMLLATKPYLNEANDAAMQY